MDFLRSLEGKILEYCLFADQKIASVLKINLNLADQCAFIDSMTEEIVFGLVALIGVLVIAGIYLIFQSSKSSTRFRAKLVNLRTITHDTKIFTFDLPVGMNKIGLKVGEHLELEAVINGQTVARKYTPISRADLKRNSFDLLIKIYHKTETMSGGKMTMYLDTLRVGDSITVTLPYGRFNYKGNSVVQIKQLNGKATTQTVDHIYMVGGGTGITPLYQIIQYITEAETETKKPELTLLFANRTEDDILMKSQIEDLERENKQFRCYFSIDKSIKEGWDGLVGFIDEEKLKKTLPAITKNTLFAVCGPPVLCNIVEKLLTTKFNVDANQFFRF